MRVLRSVSEDSTVAWVRDLYLTHDATRSTHRVIAIFLVHDSISIPLQLFHRVVSLCLSLLLLVVNLCIGLQ